MEKEYKIKYSTIISVLYAIFAFWSLNPYFTWNTYLGGILGKIYNFPIKSVFALLSILFAILFFAKTKKASKDMIKPAFLMFFIVFVMLVICGGLNNQPFDTAWLAYIAILIMFFLPRNIQKKSFDIFATLYTLSLIIPLITFFITEVLKINIPYSVLYPQEIYKLKMGVFYKHRFLSAQLSREGYSILRFNGIYYEAGIVGTLCGLLLGVYDYDVIGKGKWKQRVLLLSGICSLTLSFILLSAIFFIIKNIKELKVKNVVAIVLALCIYFIFISINFSNPILKLIQSRVVVEDYTIQGDNRTDKAYNQFFLRFYNGNSRDILFGYGRNAFEKVQNEHGFDGSSYKSILYNYGYIGFLLYLYWFMYVSMYISKRNKISFKEFVPLFFMQIANVYQKPDIFAIYYILIYIGGIIFVLEKEENNELSD